MSKVNLKNAVHIKGWATEDKLTILANLAKKASHIIEVGTYRGRSARAMIDNAPKHMHLSVVDTWDYKFKGGKVTIDDFNSFMRNTRDVRQRVTAYQMRSDLAAEMIEGRHGLQYADLVYLDGGHDYETVKRDIELYRRFVRPGGILCGDDYHHQWPGVMKAVNETFGKVKVKHTIWRVQL